jgi:hypothetical protein
MFAGMIDLPHLAIVKVLDHLSTTMGRTRSRKLKPRVQRVDWEDVETSRGTKSKMVKLKSKPNSFRRSPTKASPSKRSSSHYNDAMDMDMYMDCNPEYEPSTEAPSKVSVTIKQLHIRGIHDCCSHRMLTSESGWGRGQLTSITS